MGKANTPNPCDKFRCQFCRFPYPNIAALTRHVKNAHVIGQFICSSCGNCKIPKYRKDFYRDDHHTCIGRVSHFEVGLVKVTVAMARLALSPMLDATFDDRELDRVLPKGGDFDGDVGEEVYTYPNYVDCTRFTLSPEKRRGRSRPGSEVKKSGPSGERERTPPPPRLQTKRGGTPPPTYRGSSPRGRKAGGSRGRSPHRGDRDSRRGRSKGTPRAEGKNFETGKGIGKGGMKRRRMASPGESGGYFLGADDPLNSVPPRAKDPIPAANVTVRLEKVAEQKGATLSVSQGAASPKSPGSSWRDLEGGRSTLSDYLGDSSAPEDGSLPPSQDPKGKVPVEEEQEGLGGVNKDTDMGDLEEAQDNDSVVFGDSWKPGKGKSSKKGKGKGKGKGKAKGKKTSKRKEVLEKEEKDTCGDEKDTCGDEKDEDTGVPKWLSHVWGGRVAPGKVNCRNQVKVHWLDPAPITTDLTNEEGVQCFRVPAVSRSTGAFCLLDAPVDLGSPLAVFRDCPEFVPYMTPMVPVAEFDVSRWHQTVTMSATSQWRSQAPDPEG